MEGENDVYYNQEGESDWVERHGTLLEKNFNAFLNHRIMVTKDQLARIRGGNMQDINYCLQKGYLDGALAAYENVKQFLNMSMK